MCENAIDVLELMRRHVEALYTCDDAGRLLAVNEPGGAAALPHFLEDFAAVVGAATPKLLAELRDAL